jgi:glycosyltransferase involved in cell wall biosynthesis
MTICAVIPAFNEAARIAAAVEGARQHTAAVVVVDDGSTDGTAEIAEAAGAICLRHQKNQGKGAAMRTGIAYALDHGFSLVLFLDGDGQHNPADIPLLIEAAHATGADLVIGARTFHRAGMPLARYCSNRLGSLIASWLAGQPIHDSQSGFRLVRTDKLRSLRLCATKYEIEMEILLKLSRAGARIVHVPVETVYEGGRARSKMRPVRDTVRICFCSLAFRWGK